MCSLSNLCVCLWYEDRSLRRRDIYYFWNVMKCLYTFCKSLLKIWYFVSYIFFIIKKNLICMTHIIIYSVLQNLTVCKRGILVLIFFVNSATFWFLVNLIFLVFFWTAYSGWIDLIIFILIVVQILFIPKLPCKSIFFSFCCQFFWLCIWV